MHFRPQTTKILGLYFTRSMLEKDFPEFSSSRVKHLSIQQVFTIGLQFISKASKQANNISEMIHDQTANSPVSSFHCTLSFTNGYWSGSEYI